jgi:hypothetical protein
VDKKLKKKLATPDEVKLLRRVMAELVRKSESELAAFSCSKHRDYNHDYQLDEGEVPCFKEWNTRLEICYVPERDPNSVTKDIEKIELTWTTQTGYVYVDMYFSSPNPTNPNSSRHRNREEHSADFELGANCFNKGVYQEWKKDFLRLYKKIEAYYEVFLVQKRKEEFESAVYAMFPALLDEILMEKQDDEEES